ncbi:MAG: flagellar assembly protein T N-terminal domain-containing protein [Myxococcota bacterium]
MGGAALLLSVALSAPGAASGSVTVTGVAAVVDNDVPLARDRALDDAKRKAVEQVAGTRVSAETVAEDFQLVSDRIYARASGFVRNYEILGEGREGETYEVRVKANVDGEALKADLDLLFATKPRVIVLVAEQNIGSSRPNFWWGSSGASANLSLLQTSLIGEWQPVGYTFIDPGMLAGKLEVAAPLQTPELSNAAAQRLAADADADVAVVGQVLVNDAGPVMEGVTMHAYHAVGTLRVVGVDTGKILAVAEDTGVAAHIDPNLGGRLAIKALAKKIGPKLQKNLLEKWVSEASSSREIELVIDGVKNGKDARILERGLTESVRGVESVHVRRRRKGRAYLTLKVKARSQDFARDLEGHRFEAFSIRVNDVSRTKIAGTVDRSP